ncbi:MAG: RNA 2',3'-cyclic phosphodiesterase, partial [Sphingopyxis sp.]
SGGGVAGARWQSADQLHLTLSFLGDVGEERLGDLSAALAAIRGEPVPLSCREVGHFASKGRATTLWAAAGPADALSALAAKVDHAVRTVGITPQGLAFVPHITLARLNRSSGPIDGFLGTNAALVTPNATIRAFGLYQSHLGPEGARYKLLRDYPLFG